MDSGVSVSTIDGYSSFVPRLDADQLRMIRTMTELKEGPIPTVLDTSCVRTGLQYQLANGRLPVSIDAARSGRTRLFMELDTLNETWERLPRFAEQLNVPISIDEGVREIPGQRLSDDEVGDVAAGDEQGAFRAKEVGELRLQFTVKRMVARGQSGSGHVQPVFLHAGLQGRDDARMAGEPEVVAAGEIGKLAVTIAHVGAVDLLKRLGLGHGGKV